MTSCSEAMIAQVVRATPREAAALAISLPEEQRAQLAVFCNARSHLRDHGRAIAAGCSLFTLSSVGGAAGSALFEFSRSGLSDAAVGRHWRRPVTLAGLQVVSQPA